MRRSRAPLAALALLLVLGAAPAGARGVSVMELQGGRIRRNTAYWNLADLQRQVGPPPSARAPRS